MCNTILINRSDTYLDSDLVDSRLFDDRMLSYQGLIDDDHNIDLEETSWSHSKVDGDPHQDSRMIASL